MTTLAEDVKAARREHDPPLSQSQLARLCDVSLRTIQRIEAGDTKNPRVAFLEAFQQKLGRALLAKNS